MKNLKIINELNILLNRKIYKRKKEINKVLDQLIKKGVNPQNIFLTGYSAGGWTFYQ